MARIAAIGALSPESRHPSTGYPTEVRKRSSLRPPSGYGWRRGVVAVQLDDEVESSGGGAAR
jgi:hypothetical protein